jgi:decaprenylphospho-beta-D-erythro-pentofuranosid-2-ulose 2-reductase
VSAVAGRPLRVAVLGATSAIAEACARVWAMQGARLFLAGRRAELLGAMAADLRVRGAEAVVIWPGDLSDVAVHPELIDALTGALDRPDVVLLAWGTLTDQTRAEDHPDYAAREVTGNFTAPVALLLGLTPVMVAGKSGVLACITSVAGERGRASNFVYGAAKGGLQRFLEGLRHRLHRDGVTVLDIRPGFVSTPMTAHLPQSGPLWAEPQRVALDIVRGIERRKPVVYAPWFWRWIILVVRCFPRFVMHRTRL